ARVATLIDALPPRIRNELDGLDPARYNLSNARADYIVMHGRRDNLIPYLESLALSRSLPADQVELFIIDGLVHLDLEAERQDVPRLIEALHVLLAQRH
ncbi:MAG: alpha/beta hydrolase, partial [Gammaproteobacteria bacterium]|nr:alpha/beta hydrolase [Gammaproteobacteria bacterium]